MQNFSGSYFLQAIWSTHPKIFINIILDNVNDQLSALGAYLKAKNSFFRQQQKLPGK